MDGATLMYTMVLIASLIGIARIRWSERKRRHHSSRRS